MIPPTLDELRAALTRAETEYVCSLYIENTNRMQRECAYWAGEVGRLRQLIAERGEGRSGVWEKRA